MKRPAEDVCLGESVFIEQEWQCVISLTYQGEGYIYLATASGHWYKLAEWQLVDVRERDSYAKNAEIQTD